MIKLTILFCYIKNVLYVLRNCSNIIIYYRRVVYNYITGVMRIMKKFQKLIFTLCLTLFSLNILLSFSSKKYEDIPCPTRIENDVDINEIA